MDLSWQWASGGVHPEQVLISSQGWQKGTYNNLNFTAPDNFSLTDELLEWRILSTISAITIIWLGKKQTKKILSSLSKIWKYSSSTCSIFACCWCPTNSCSYAASCLSYPCLLCPLFLRVIVLVRVIVNCLHPVCLQSDILEVGRSQRLHSVPVWCPAVSTGRLINLAPLVMLTQGQAICFMATWATCNWQLAAIAKSIYSEQQYVHRMPPYSCVGFAMSYKLYFKKE